MNLRSSITGFGLLFLISFGTAALAEPAEGVEFERVQPPVTTETGDQIEVLELFWYGCPHCYYLEPVIKPWVATLPEGVVFRRMPAVFGNPLWALHARAFYTAEALGDYCAGPNHVLPTSRTARFSSPLGVYDFQKRSSLILVSPAGATTLGRTASVLARGEGLEAHARSAEYRIEKAS